MQQPGDAFRKLAKPAFIKTSCSLFLTVLAFLLFWLDIVLRRFGMMELVATLPKSLFIRQKVWNEKSRKIFLPKRRGTFEKTEKKLSQKQFLNRRVKIQHNNSRVDEGLVIKIPH